MALHLNLYHEVQKAQALKRRDPLKLSIYGLAAIAAGFAIYYFIQLGRGHVLHQELTRAQAEFAALAPQAAEAKKQEDEISGRVKAGELLTKRIEGRFYWAPVLEQIAQVVPREVQITRFAGEVSGEGQRRCALTLDGLAAGSDPRHVAEELRQALKDTFDTRFKSVNSTYKSLEDGTEIVLLDGQQNPTATFAISVQMTVSDETAAPAPRKKR